MTKNIYAYNIPNCYGFYVNENNHVLGEKTKKKISKFNKNKIKHT